MIIDFWFLSEQNPWSDWFLWLSHWLIWNFFLIFPVKLCPGIWFDVPSRALSALLACYLMKTSCEAGVFLTPLPGAMDFASPHPQQQWIFVMDPEQEEQTGFVSVYYNGMALLVKNAFTLTWLVGSWSSPDTWLMSECAFYVCLWLPAIQYYHYDPPSGFKKMWKFNWFLLYFNGRGWDHSEKWDILFIPTNNPFVAITLSVSGYIF